MESKGNILLVEDDKNLGFVLRDFLEMEGFKIQWKHNGQEGYEMYKKKDFDILLLDVMMPVKDGFTVAEQIRKDDIETPIIFITAKNLQEDKIKGLRLGADDYITKPFSTEELILRINAILKRTRPANLDGSTDVFNFGKFTFDPKNQSLKGPSGERILTRKESDMLRLLCKNMNNVVKREEALRIIWGENDYFMGRSMDVYITKLRKFLKDDEQVNIVNIHNTGFKLDAPE